jgi:hypothetical protein
VTRALAKREPQALMPLESVVAVRGEWVEAKRTELAGAEEALEALEALYGPDATRVRRVRGRVTLLRRVVRALERGYIPLPRFGSTRVNALEELPLRAVLALKAATDAAVFDEVRYVGGMPSESHRGRQGRRAQRDPLLIGVVRTPAIELPEDERHGGFGPRYLPGEEEHFLIAWWRPEDERMEVMF